MTDYIIRRLLMGVIVLVLVTMFVFIVMRLLPSDPLTLFLSQSETQRLDLEQLAQLKHEYGLDRPFPIQYWDWMSGVVRGDFGTSIILKERVNTLIAQHLPVTVHLGILAFLISGVLGVLFGVLCALKRGSWLDNLLTVLANLGITAPSFWVGILLILIIAYKLGWLPIYGYTSPFEDLWMSTKQVIMPVFCLSLAPMAILTRQTRSSMLEVVRQDYIRTAWSKGLRERVVIMRHALKNAFIPIITMQGMQIRNIVGGAVIIETVFSIPGVGRMMVDAVKQQDYQVVQGGVLFIAIAVMIVNIAVDISYGYFDPRIKLS